MPHTAYGTRRTLLQLNTGSSPLHSCVSRRSGLANLNLAYGSECAVDAMQPTPAGFHDVWGNLWQWHEDFFAALPGSHGVHPYYGTVGRRGGRAGLLGGLASHCLAAHMRSPQRAGTLGVRSALLWGGGWGPPATCAYAPCMDSKHLTRQQCIAVPFSFPILRWLAPHTHAHTCLQPLP